MERNSLHIDRIRELIPDLDVSKIELNTDGLNNDVLIVNKERVFRFPKTPGSKQALDNEAKILPLVRQYVNIRIPIFDYSAEDCVSYEYIPGDPLHRDYILRQDEVIQDHIAEQFASFLKQIHTIPTRVLESEDIPISGAARTYKQWHEMYELAKQEMFPYLWSDQKDWVNRLFEPILSGRMSIEYTPVLIHGDLGAYHILLDSVRGQINGIVDFGTAGLGDPASDFGTIINQFGESFLARMSKFYPEIANFIDRARFRSATVELEWTINGILNKDISWFMVHIGLARDVMPIETSFGIE